MAHDCLVPALSGSLLRSLLCSLFLLMVSNRSRRTYQTPCERIEALRHVLMLLLFLFHQLFEMTCSPPLPLLLDNSSLEHAPWRVFVLLHCLFQQSSTPGLLFRSTPGLLFRSTQSPGLLFRSTQSPAFASPCRLL